MPMGCADGSVNSGSHSDDVNAILNQILDYEPTGNILESLIPYSVEGEVADNFSSLDLMLDTADSEMNLCRDLQSVDLNASYEPRIEDILADGEAQNYSNPSIQMPSDGAVLEKTNLEMNPYPDLRSIAMNMSYDHIMEDPEKLSSFKTESELKKTGVDLLCEAAAMEKDVLDPKDETEKELLDLDETQRKLKRKASITGFKPRKKAFYKHKGISLRLSRTKSGI